MTISGIPFLEIKRLESLIKDGTCMSGINSRIMARLLAQVNMKYIPSRQRHIRMFLYNGPG